MKCRECKKLIREFENRPKRKVEEGNPEFVRYIVHLCLSHGLPKEIGQKYIEKLYEK